MKTAYEILNKAYIQILENKSNLHQDIDPVLVEAMKEYAQQACEDLRERIAEESCLDPNGMLLQVDKQSILETKIILPWPQTN